MSFLNLQGSATLSSNVRASLFMIVSMTSFAINDAFVKLATEEISPAQVMLVRGLVASVLLLALAAWHESLLPVREAFRPALLVRSLGDVGATITYITALTQMPLANASAIFQALPLTVTLGAVIFFGERVGWRRWTAIGVGLVGVLVIIRPGTEGFTLYSVLVLVSVFCAAVRDLVTRRMPRTVPTLFVASITAAAVTIVGALLLPFSGWAPLSGATLAYLCAGAIFIILGYISIVEAMRLGDTGFVAPFRYSVLVTAFLLGIFVFGELPSFYELLGSAILVGSGIYMIVRERRVVGRVEAQKSQVH